MTRPTVEEAAAAFAAIAEHTRPECASCLRPHSCCGAVHCEDAIHLARSRYGVELPRTGHATLPLMGPDGCTAAPHYRPLCAVHTCAVEGLGYKPGDKVWTVRYFELRNAVDLIEARYDDLGLLEV